MFAQPESVSTRLDAIDAAQLTPLVRKMLNRPALTVTQFEQKRLLGGVGGAKFDTFIYRFSGEAVDGDESVPWSLILKIMLARTGEDLSSTHYWKREAEVYQSGLLNQLDRNFRGVRCLSVIEYPSESCWMWQEEITDVIGRRWPLEHYGTLGRHFGQFNGIYLAGEPLPSEPWLSADWLRKGTDPMADFVARAQAAMALPQLQNVFPQNAVAGLEQIWQAREHWLDALDQLPQAFCHLDGFRRNLFAGRAADGTDETIAIDWAYSGIAAVGVDIAVCVTVSLWLHEIDASDIDALDTLIFGGYLKGLADVGWHGDPRLIRLGYTAGLVAKNIEMIPIISLLSDPGFVVFFESNTGHPLVEIQRQIGTTFAYVLRLADEARTLLNL